MGVKISELVNGKQVTVDELKGKTLAVDAFNMLYQFITTIRQPDGSPLTDSKGRTTSHLIGLFYRLTNLLKKDVRFVFVFDGESHELKQAETRRRADIKQKAEEMYKEAKEVEDLEQMKKYASRTARLSKEMIQESKDLISAMGIPFIEAPSEGEAQCAKIVRDGNAYAVMSQDADSMLFGAPRIIKNLSISQRRKKHNSLGSEKTQPLMIELKDVLEELQIDQERLIIMGILIGTDFNPGGIKGIGPKKALRLVKEYEEPNKIFEELGWDDHFEHDWTDILQIFKESHSTGSYDISQKSFDKEKVVNILVREHDFSEERIGNICDELSASTEKEQKALEDFF